jgi:hypothetical protein
MAERAREIAKTAYSQDTFGEQFEEFYFEIFGMAAT